MKQRGHLGLNLLLFSPVAWVLAGDRAVLLLGIGLLGVVAGSGLPDVDHGLPTKHRGATHTVWFALLASGGYAGLWWVIDPASVPIGAAAVVAFGGGFVACAGHLVGDALTPHGVRPFAPVSGHRFAFGLPGANGRVVNETAFVAGVVWCTVVVLASAGVGGLPSVG